MAYILQVNGHAAGSKPLRGSSGLAIGTTRGATPPAGATRPTAGGQHGADAGAQAGGRLPSGDDPTIAGPVAFINPREVPNFTPVTDAMLQAPPPGEWLSWRRTLDGHGHSPRYSIGGKQYIAVPAGVGAFPNIRRLLSPDIYAPPYGDALYVFELPEPQLATTSSGAR